MAQPINGDNEPLPAHQEAMLEACKSGQLLTLQQLFQLYDVKHGDSPIYHTVPPSGPPATHEMITVAVANKRTSIVTHLLSIYPEVNLRLHGIVQAALDNPHVETFQVLHSHSPDIVNFEFNYIATILTNACFGGPESLPLIHYLLDNGADTSIRYFGGVITAALWYSQPVEVIQKMADKGAVINSGLFSLAISYQRLDALAFFFERGRTGLELNEQDLLEDARKTKNEEVVALVKSGFRKWQMRVKMSKIRAFLFRRKRVSQESKGNAVYLGRLKEGVMWVQGYIQKLQLRTEKCKQGDRRDNRLCQKKQWWQFWRGETTKKSVHFDRSKEKSLEADSDMESIEESTWKIGN